MASRSDRIGVGVAARNAAIRAINEKKAERDREREMRMWNRSLMEVLPLPPGGWTPVIDKFNDRYAELLRDQIIRAVKIDLEDDRSGNRRGGISEIEIIGKILPILFEKRFDTLDEYIDEALKMFGLTESDIQSLKMKRSPPVSAPAPSISKTQPKRQPRTPRPPPTTEELGFEWSDEWVLPEKRGTHIQEDWLMLLDDIYANLEDEVEELSEEDIISILIPKLFEKPLATWGDYYEKAVKMILASTKKDIQEGGFPKVVKLKERSKKRSKKLSKRRSKKRYKKRSKRHSKRRYKR